MKVFFSIILSVFCIVIGFGQGIQFFEGTWNEAKSKAEEEGKLIFVDAYANWCGPCKRMAKYEFTKADVGEYFNEHFINVKMNMEGKEGRKFGQKFPVSAYPTLFFISSEGKIESKSVGGKKGEDLIKMGKDVMSKFDFSVEYKKAYDKGDRSFETVLNYVKTLNQSNKPSLKIANDYLKSNHGMTKDQMNQFVFEAATEADSKIFKKFLKNKRALNKLFGKDKVDEKIGAACTRTVNKAIDFQYPALVEEAAEMYKDAINSKDKSFVPALFIQFALADQDEKMMLANSKKFLKYADTKKQFKWAKEVLRVFPKSTEIINIGIQKLRKVASESMDINEIKLYSSLLVRSGDLDEAIAFLDKKIGLVDSPAHKRELQQFISSYKGAQ